jgi:putative peptidoglycan lipid II flippase
MKNLKDNIKRIDTMEILNPSFFVAILSALTFLGFFLRDFYITERFGLSVKSDTIFFVSVIPMFFVSIFCIPFGQASIPFLNQIKKSELQPAASYFFSISLVFCFILCFVSYVIYDLSFLVFGNYFSNMNIKPAILAFLPLLFLSGWLIFCNSILLTKEYYLLPNLAQLVVPFIAVVCLLLFASSLGIYSVIFGMVFGQIVNLIIVTNALIKEKIFFKAITFKPPPSLKKNFWGGYGYLVVIAIFSSINIPINTFIANDLGDGAISIFNLGIKFNLFICGLFTAIFSSVIFPYFSKGFISGGSDNLNNETSFLLIFTTICLLPFSILIFNYSDVFTFLVFGQIINDKPSMLGVSSVIKYSVIQLPFWVYNAIILKHGSVINKVNIIAFVSIIISVLNVIFAFFFLKFMNVGGLSLSIAISNGIGSFLLLLYYIKNKYITFSRAIIIIMVWISFIGLIIFFNQEKFLTFLSNVFI